ncbi:MAG: oxidoreductase [Sphingobacteriales bacterium 17-39-43]|uniref:SDR family NAD(P)-dependent oxidoreductase n=1 Tax=Daejeonella sp. TaxID=2805397 RepID=UPI000BD72006|nr:SDR family oxidoreductase [Daejeonella sp.]OYX95185.1 MAG: oxidoreductase [Sphingobacteriia bacterium 35-40-5]OYZ31168.1 MAG: oxidoreductase [Sphingobacteriales bacterium 16-39-50]OYZ49602.1 MAG: oxidoreductase [Sphingobacteriales bacterium 24-40-4]OZA24047.1 MAG: oxidoreductase [Sphingobacteriales bacterium 17-39-43]HQS06524.1 SDR family oxidoreductase [Daejeonella sp.]
MDFRGKNVLVVGGSSGIGLKLVSMLASQGAQIYNASRSKSEDWPDGLIHIPIDVLSNFDLLAEQLPGNLHGLVYAVGSINLKPFSRYTEEDFINDYKLNVTGAARCIQLAYRSLRNSGSASIVLLSSVAAKTGMPYHASIAAAKGGVEGLALSLAAEFASQNIRVNVVAPSLTDTSLAGNLLNTPEKREASAKRHPLGRIGKPEDIASAISFLLSDESGWISGQVLGIDGGMGNLKTL